MFLGKGGLLPGLNGYALGDSQDSFSISIVVTMTYIRISVTILLNPTPTDSQKRHWR